MIALPQSLFLDTNVWIANYIGGRDDAIGARALVDFCLSREIALCVGIPSMKDIYYGVGAYLKAETRRQEGAVTEPRALAIEQLAWQSLCNLMENAVLVPVDSSDVAETRMLHEFHRDFEDNLVVATCKRTRADYLVTSDKQLLAKALVPSLSPSDMLAFLEACAPRRREAGGALRTHRAALPKTPPRGGRAQRPGRGPALACEHQRRPHRPSAGGAGAATPAATRRSSRGRASPGRCRECTS